jgi:hypothetical protein
MREQQELRKKMGLPATLPPENDDSDPESVNQDDRLEGDVPVSRLQAGSLAEELQKF